MTSSAATPIAVPPRLLLLPFLALGVVPPSASARAAAGLGVAENPRRPRGLRRNAPRRGLMGSTTNGTDDGGDDDDDDDDAHHAHHHGGFAALPCNANLTNSAPCQPWSARFGPGLVRDAEAVVPCGVCVEMDDAMLPGAAGSINELELRGGLNVEGRLLFPRAGDPSSGGLRISTPHLFVQGRLSLYHSADGGGNPTYEVDANAAAAVPENIPSSGSAGAGAPNLEFRLTGAESVPFEPHPHNAAACGGPGGTCDVSKKAVVVAGGELDVRAMPDACPSFVKLLDVVTSGPYNLGADEYESYPGLGGHTACVASSGTILSDSSSRGSSWAGWDGSDSPTAVTVAPEGYLLASSRTKSTYGPRVLIYDPSPSSGPECKIRPDVPYLFLARVKLINPAGAPSQCQTIGKCFRLQSHRVGRYNKNHYTNVGPRHDAPTADGEWFTFRTVAVFTEAELADAAYGRLYLKLVGAPANMDIALDDVSLVQAPETSYAPLSDACTDLLRNGGASSSGGHYFPWEPRSGGTIGVLHDPDGTTYFCNSGRSKVYSGLEQALPVGCVSPGVEYAFHAEIRIRSASGDASGGTSSSVQAVIKLVATLPGGHTKHYELARCPSQAAGDGWKNCAAVHVFTDEQASATEMSLITMISESEAHVVDWADVALEFHEGVGRELLVPPAAGRCYGPGAQVLVTSTTNDYRGGKVVTVTASGVRPAGEDSDEGEVGFLAVDGDVGDPSSESSSPGCGAEVALLSRNVAFTAATDDDPESPRHGGHLMVLHTGADAAAQHLQGVEVRGFGQQGNLGRYPVHFHMCGHVPGSAVRKNVVRASRQRCFVAHGTHELLVEDNVAYDAKGHCYITEDGGEMRNEFRAQPSPRSSTPVSVLFSPADSDDRPAAFWMTNPSNDLVGNVAAGSENAGFWYEVEAFIRGQSKDLPENEGLDPCRLPLGEFRDNVAHSNNGNGLQTYPSCGYKPPMEAVFRNLRSYRNTAAGVFIHNGAYQALDGGLFADNRVAVDVDRSHTCRVSNLDIVGYSPDYRARHGDAVGCPASFGKRHRGLQINPQKQGRDWGGTAMSNVTFSNFGTAGTGGACPDGVALDVDDREAHEYFDPRTYARGLRFKDCDPAVSLCAAEAAGVIRVAIKDDGTLAGSGEAGFLVSDVPEWRALTDCHPLAANTCAAFCPGVCFRVLSVTVGSLTPDDTVLTIADDVTGRSLSIPGTFDRKWTADGAEDHYKNTWYTLTRRFLALVPSGASYTARFSVGGETMWPVFSDVAFEDEPGGCNDDEGFAAFRYDAPPPACDDLIANGDAGDTVVGGSTDGWLHSGGGVHLAAGGALGTPFALQNTQRNSYANGLGQYVDTRCLEEGAKFRFSAYVRVYNEVGSVGPECDPAARTCPIFRLTSSGGGGDTVYREIFAFSAWAEGEWNLAAADITITADEAARGKSFFWVYGPPGGKTVLLDQVSISKVSSSE